MLMSFLPGAFLFAPSVPIDYAMRHGAARAMSYDNEHVPLRRRHSFPRLAPPRRR